MDEFDRDIVQELSRCVLSLRAQLDQAEARVPAINRIISELAALDLLDEVLLLGLVIYDGHYSISQESGHIVIAALVIPGGFGVVNCEARDYTTSWNSSSHDDTELRSRFIPFEECPSAIRALLLPQVHPLLLVLLQSIRAQNDPE